VIDRYSLVDVGSDVSTEEATVISGALRLLTTQAVADEARGVPDAGRQMMTEGSCRRRRPRVAVHVWHEPTSEFVRPVWPGSPERGQWRAAGAAARDSPDRRGSPRVPLRFFPRLCAGACAGLARPRTEGRTMSCSRAK